MEVDRPGPVALPPGNTGHQGIKARTVVVVTEGSRVVGYFHVAEVLAEP